MGDDSPAAYLRAADQVAVYRMSAIGMCSRALAELRMGEVGAAPPDWLLERFEEGHELEPVILGRVQRGEFAHPGKVQFAFEQPTDLAAYRDLPYTRPEHLDQTGQFTCEIPIGQGVVLKGHLDGIARVALCDDAFRVMWGLQLGDRVVVEAKKFRKDNWAKWQKDGIEAFPMYQAQVTAVMRATGLPCLFVVGRYDEEAEGRIAEIGARLFTDPPVGFGSIAARVVKIELRAREGDGYDECDRRTFPCPVYAKFHLGETAGEQVVVEVVAEEQREIFETIAAALAAGQRMQKTGKSMADDARRRLKEWLESNGGANDGRELISERFKVRYTKTHVEESTRTVKAFDRITIKVDRLDEEKAA